MTEVAGRIREALLQVGVEVESVWDLLSGRTDYRKAIPLLAKLLEDGISDKTTREGVIRALATKDARGIVGQALIKEFYGTPVSEEHLRWAIGNSMEVVITDDCVPEIVKIVSDKRNGIARQMFVLALGKTRSKSAEDVLIELLNDAEVAPHAASALGRLKSRRACDELTKLLKSPSPLARREAGKALKKIQK